MDFLRLATKLSEIRLIFGVEVVNFDVFAENSSPVQDAALFNDRVSDIFWLYADSI